MNILFVVPYVPSLVRVRSYNLIRRLHARGHRVTVATLVSGPQDQEQVEALAPDCDHVSAVRLPAWQSLLNCAAALPRSEPLQTAYSWSKAFLDEILELAREAEVTHVEHLRAARYALQLKAHAQVTTPIVWDSVDCISYLFEQAVAARPDLAGRMVNRLELSRTRSYEANIWSRFDRVLMTSEIDRRALLGLGPHDGSEQSVRVVPNGVDTEYFAPTGEPREPRTLVFSGKMSYHANVAAIAHLLTEVMPHVWSTMPDVRVLVVGKDPTRLVKTLAARAGSRVVVTGTVPDVRPYLRHATVAVTPLVYGAGSQLKLLEAMACATPVVATPRAVAALSARPGRDLLVAEEPKAFADAVVRLLSDSGLQLQVGRAGRAYVETHHRWDTIAARLEGIYAELLVQRGGTMTDARQPSPVRAAHLAPEVTSRGPARTLAARPSDALTANARPAPPTSGR